MSEAVDRQALYGGTEAPPAHLELDRAKLSAYLAERLPGFGTLTDVVKFKGGQSNPTYLITATGGRYALRRKPPGTLVQSAHEIDRECRVMSALVDVGIPVPRPHLYCDDKAVIDSDFYIADYVEGRVYWEAWMPDAAPEGRAASYDDMNGILARLHDLDPAAVGLAELGPPTGYAARNLARWSKIYRFAALTEIPDMDWLMDALAERVPQAAPTTLIHGDFGLYNMILHPTAPDVLAVLDWEMATLGDPYVDLAHHLRPWWDPPDDRGSTTFLTGRDLAALGIPGMDDYIDRYCKRRGVGLPDMTWYLAYAQFRYASMVQGILKRAADGTNSSRVMLHRQDRVALLAAMARKTLATS